jgi:phosphate transport system substrate-binding protein
MPQLARLEPTGALRAFCQGSAAQKPDVVIASRRIEAAELDICRRNGIDSILESHVGYLAAVLATAPGRPAPNLSPREVYLALAKRIPEGPDSTRLIENPNVMWNQIDARLGTRNIDVIGPPRDSPTAYILTQLVLGAGCDTFSWIRALKDVDPRRHDEICHTLRTDGAYREVPAWLVEVAQTQEEEEEELYPRRRNVRQEARWMAVSIIKELRASPDSLAVLDYDSYKAHRAELVGSVLGGVEPTWSAMTDGAYVPVVPVYIYTHAFDFRAKIGSVGDHYVDFLETLHRYAAWDDSKRQRMQIELSTADGLE